MNRSFISAGQNKDMWLKRHQHLRQKSRVMHRFVLGILILWICVPAGGVKGGVKGGFKIRSVSSTCEVLLERSLFIRYSSITVARLSERSQYMFQTSV